MNRAQTLNRDVNKSVYMVQVQLRLPDKTVEEIDHLVKNGMYKSRSDAIRAIIILYEERERTRKFYDMLVKRSFEAEDHPKKLIPLERG